MFPRIPSVNPFARIFDQSHFIQNRFYKVDNLMMTMSHDFHCANFGINYNFLPSKLKILEKNYFRFNVRLPGKIIDVKFDIKLWSN